MCTGCASLCHTEGELYIRRLQKPSGPNLLDKPWKDFIVKPVCPLRPCKPRVYGDHDSQWKCTTSAECKTGISAVLTVTSGLGPLCNRWSLLNYNMLMFLLFILHITWSYVDSGLKTTWCYSYVKTLPTKSYMQLNPCHAFLASWTPCYACWVRHGLTLAIFPTSQEGYQTARFWNC
jgi:hypothetical protein